MYPTCWSSRAFRLHTTQFLTGSVCTVASAMEFVHTKMCSKKLTPASCAACLINPTSVVPLPGFGPGEDTLGERQGCHYITSGLPPLGCGLIVGIKAGPPMCYCTTVDTRTSHLWGLRPQVRIKDWAPPSTVQGWHDCKIPGNEP